VNHRRPVATQFTTSRIKRPPSSPTYRVLIIKFIVTFSVGCRQKAMEHHLDVFAQSGAEEEEEDGNSYVIPCFFRKSRMCWISCGVYGRVRVSLGDCQMLISQIGLSGGPSDHRLNTAWHHINSICIVVNSCCFLAPGAARKQKTANLHQAAVKYSP
jgi:hypothetical protein